ncbi:hypothetical protein GYMLUDRAFT_59752 [Collybiopsis luxurians FD-317 M1]|uniref:DUF6533 domain-containing protein n=1 Tax=Collybiopsis luxurians FD-317 M1 TaxID=944289 RepID=A0A0D0CMZ7_9AGAR|nr:hypothetical protein GYMLUDRAFT_59752 [Collybiopsis luxurians FD-317 M1]
MNGHLETGCFFYTLYHSLLPRSNHKLQLLPCIPCSCSAWLVIVVYDYMLTLSMEVEHFWKSTLGYGGILFYLNRYFTLLGIIPSALLFLWSEALSRNNMFYFRPIQVDLS